MICIVGSGLTAMAAATALIQRGGRPTILDTGLSPEPDALLLKSKLAATDPLEWDPQDLRSAHRTGPVSANGIPRKLYFGSDFVFNDLLYKTALDLSGASLFRSFAAGGFSNLWGSVIQPFPAGEFANWPVTYGEMQPHYCAVQRLLHCGHSVAPDAGEWDPDAGQLRPSSQAKALYADLWQNRRQLADQGIRFGYARLAVRTADQNGTRGCCYCGLCLHGCPYDCKYTAAATLSRLIHDNRIRYVPGVAVDRISIEDRDLLVESRSVHDGSPVRFRAERVILAAGFLESSRIILSSLRMHGIRLWVKHSDIFTLPVIRYSASRSVKQESLHTLCQIVSQIEDPAAGSHPVHLQLYGYNDLYSILMAQRLGTLSRLLAPVVRALETRLWVIFGYLHSSVSSSISIMLTADRNPGLRVEGHSNPQARIAARAAARKLVRNQRLFRAIPLWRRLRLDLPGGGYHSGGSFPMKRTPGPLETDRLGSLPSLPRVHIVDASVFPEIPSLPTAFTAMANAHRIASEIEISDAG